MAFNLSSLDQLDTALGSGPARSSKFAAKIKARPRARGAAAAGASAAGAAAPQQEVTVEADTPRVSKDSVAIEELKHRSSQDSRRSSESVAPSIAAVGPAISTPADVAVPAASAGEATRTVPETAAPAQAAPEAQAPLSSSDMDGVACATSVESRRSEGMEGVEVTPPPASTSAPAEPPLAATAATAACPLLVPTSSVSSPSQPPPQQPLGAGVGSRPTPAAAAAAAASAEPSIPHSSAAVAVPASLPQAVQASETQEAAKEKTETGGKEERAGKTPGRGRPRGKAAARTAPQASKEGAGPGSASEAQGAGAVTAGEQPVVKAKRKYKPRAPRAPAVGVGEETDDEGDMDVTGLTLKQIIRKFTARDNAKEQAKIREEKRRRLAEQGAEGAKEGAGEQAGGKQGPAAIQGAGGSGPDSRTDNVPQLTPQVRVVDGRIVVTELEAEAPLPHGGTRAAEGEYTRVEEGDLQKLNSHSYMNRRKTQRWSLQDTDLFYKALAQFGLDFTLISCMFPSRDRPQLKSKYKSENKLNPGKVDAALRGRSTDMQQYRDVIAMMKLDVNGELAARISC